MKKLLISLAFLLTAGFVRSQTLCPGGGTNYTNAVFFDPAWVSGCASGTSCSGGINFDTRATCEPTTAIDACAPIPTCVSAANTGSDIWFKFYANSPSVTINAIQNVSFVAVIQAFSGGVSGCNVMTQIGCSVAGGPSSGVSLALTNLTVNNLYYFRIFGAANGAAQRTGVICFCGSSGLSNTILPVKLLSFTGTAFGNSNSLSWKIADAVNFSHFEIEKSVDGQQFHPVGKINFNISNPSTDLKFVDASPVSGNNYYRLKMVDKDGSVEYSAIVKVLSLKGKGFTVSFNTATHQLLLFSDRDDVVNAFAVNGTRVASFRVVKGFNTVPVEWANGMYMLNRKSTADVQRITVVKE